jgi:hypothetical protein
VKRLCVEQHAELIHDSRGRFGNTGSVRMRRHSARMRGERVECRPILLQKSVVQVVCGVPGFLGRAGTVGLRQAAAELRD